VCVVGNFGFVLVGLSLYYIVCTLRDFQERRLDSGHHTSLRSMLKRHMHYTNIVIERQRKAVINNMTIFDIIESEQF
jgi:hypothetical protein